jgi:putative tricarboxylic transport membrane protein
VLPFRTNNRTEAEDIVVEVRGRPALEWVVAGSGLLVGVVLLFAGWEYGLSSRSGVGPGTFPAVAGFFLTLSAVMWLATLVRHTPAPVAGEPVSDEESPAERRSGAIRVIIVVAAIAVAAFLLPYLGFVVVMTLQLLVVLMVAGRQPWLRSLLVAVAAALATHYIFGDLLGVSLPASLVPGLSEWGI